MTDNSTAEKQWEYLFENNGKFPKSGQDMFGNNMISVAQGNHDISTFTGHINAPAQAGEAVYSYDYCNAKFIILNLESTKNDEVAREAQKAFLEKQVKGAKEAGQWTIVGFHKSIYTGASHISDGDVIEARKYWGPTLANLDVDLVLMGHDHVYSCGFITVEGVNAKLVKNDDGSYSSKDMYLFIWSVGTQVALSGIAKNYILYLLVIYLHQIMNSWIRIQQMMIVTLRRNKLIQYSKFQRMQLHLIVTI